ncbi:hypothetical protein HNP71_001685 [Acidocella aromatica]|uniref:Uncharacterized protein n=1 Tax=Acidocella aromatica TaxID=1303579 RepID=A0A840VJT0_9PROT|nr:hypothetical protein [Acidocella aromatica]
MTRLFPVRGHQLSLARVGKASDVVLNQEGFIVFYL